MKLWASSSRHLAIREPSAWCRVRQSPLPQSWPRPLALLRKQSTAICESPLDDRDKVSAYPSSVPNEAVRPLSAHLPPEEQPPNIQNRFSRTSQSKEDGDLDIVWRKLPLKDLWSIARNDSRAQEWARIVVDLLDGGQTELDHKALSLAGEEPPRRVWQAVAHRLLETDLESMTRFLEATHAQPYLSRIRIGGFLGLLAESWSRSKEKESPAKLQRFVNVFCLLCKRAEDGDLRNLNQCVWTMLQYCAQSQIAQIFRAVKPRGIHLRWNTYLHIADRLAKHGYFEEGLDALLEAHRAGAAVNTYAFRSCCSTLLRRSSEQPEGLRVCLRIVSTLVDLGVELNNPMCDIIMLNAVEAGDLNTAFSAYHFLKQRGLRPTESTIAVLLKGCKTNIDDVNVLNETIRDAVDNLNVRKSELVASEILHCLALYHCKHHPTSAFDTLTEAYAQFFDLRPLEKLGLPVSNVRQLHGDCLLPNQNALNIMIGTRIEQSLIHQPYDEGILPLYRRWRRLVETGDPCYANLATSDYTANLFLMAFIQRPDGLVYATEVVRDMQESLHTAAGVKQGKPTVQTWSIFLLGFARHKKTQLAEMVLNSMRSVGIEPNPVTWNSLMLGYARAQDEAGTLDVVRRARQSGMEWNRWTHGGLHGLQRRSRLEEELAKPLKASIPDGEANEDGTHLTLVQEWVP